MKDRDFLIWLHERMQYQYKESLCIDYMGKLRSIIGATPKDQCTPNTGGSIEDLKRG